MSSIETDTCRFAIYLAQKFGCSQIIDLGCGSLGHLAEIAPGMSVIAVGDQGSLRFAEKNLSAATVVQHDFATPLNWTDRKALKQSVVVCSGLLQKLVDPTALLATLHDLLRDAPVAVITTPDRDRIAGIGDLGPPRSPENVREWSLTEFTRLLREAELNISFSGLTTEGATRNKNTAIAVLRPPSISTASAPTDFRVRAFMCAYNEEDVIAPVLEYLTSQDVEVHLVDNWSTDRTVARAQSFLGRGLARITRFPADRASATYDWHDLLQHVATLSHESGADWCIHYDADELREACWPQVRLRDALYQVDREGFNAVDHTCIIFHPTLEQPGCDGDMRRFRWYEFGKRGGHFQQVKTWKRQDMPVQLAESGGHIAEFPGRKTYPFKFLLRHYPIRSPEHGARKVLHDRQPRWNPKERQQRGWHIQYDHIQQGHEFLVDTARLHCFDEDSFYRDYLIERLSGVGVEHT